MKKMAMIVAALLAVAGVQAGIVTNIASADAYIDQRGDKFDTNFGAAGGLLVGRYGKAYTNPVEAPAQWALFNWDLSGIDSGATVADVTLGIQMLEAGAGTIDIYSIDTGAWTEMGVTWNNFADSTHTLLGQMNSVAKASGISTFNDVDLTAVVQDWVDGDKTNLGLVFKWNGEPAEGTTNVEDNFAGREYAPTQGYISPQLVIDVVPAENVPGTTVNYSNPSTGVYYGNPSLVVATNGDYIASHDIWPGIRTFLARSQDEGKSWSLLNSLGGQYESSLFAYDGDLYLIGCYYDSEGTSIVVRKSTDGGTYWTAPSSSTNGRLMTTAVSNAYHAAASPTIVANNRIWRALESTDPVANADSTIPDASTFRSFVISAPVGSDLLIATNWTVSNDLFLSDYLAKEYGWLEGCIVPVRPLTSGSVVNMLRISHHYEKAAMIDLSTNGQIATFDSTNSVIDFNGGMSKFEILYDPESKLYWSLVNNRSDTNIVRNLLDLRSSPGLINWTHEATILYDPDADYHGFQYANFSIEDDDIIAVVRTAANGATNYHDNNYITFHRIRNFRTLSQAESTTLDAIADTKIDQHVNYMNSNFGTASAIKVETRSTAYTNPVVSPESWMLVKWDLSDFPSADIISKATFRITQVDWGVGTVNLYGINSGSWNESTVTWNNWVGSESLTYLGTMTSVSYPDGNTTFTDDELTERVRAWVDGSQTNYGLVMKWSGDAGSGDNFVSREHSSLAPPQLIVEYTPLVMNAVADADIDQSSTYKKTNFGSATTARVKAEIRTARWMLLKWDVSDIPSPESISSATLRIIQGDADVESVDVYAIDSGSWDEATVTWDNWVGTEGLTSLGTMTNVAYPDGVTEFSNSALGDWVADWADGTKTNYGIVLKWNGQTGSGDTFMTREHESLSSPQLIISYDVTP